MGEEFKSFYLTFVAAPPARNLQFEEEKAEQDLRRFRIKRRLEWEWRGGKSVIIIKWIFDASQLNIQLMYAQPNSGSAGELWRRWCGPRSRLSRWMGTQEMMRRGKSSKTLAKKKQIKLDGGWKSRAASSAIVSFLVTVIRNPRLEF